MIAAITLEQWTTKQRQERHVRAASSDPKAPGPQGPQGHNSQLCVHRIVNFDSRAGGNKSCALCYRLSQRRRIDKLLLLMTGVINSAGVESLLGAINKEHH